MYVRTYIYIETYAISYFLVIFFYNTHGIFLSEIFFFKEFILVCIPPPPHTHKVTEGSEYWGKVDSTVFFFTL